MALAMAPPQTNMHIFGFSEWMTRLGEGGWETERWIKQKTRERKRKESDYKKIDKQQRIKDFTCWYEKCYNEKFLHNFI